MSPNVGGGGYRVLGNEYSCTHDPEKALPSINHSIVSEGRASFCFFALCCVERLFLAWVPKNNLCILGRQLEGRLCMATLFGTRPVFLVFLAGIGYFGVRVRVGFT
jgi:hypothetical protein